MRARPANLILERVLFAVGLALTVVVPAGLAQQRDATTTAASAENLTGPAAEVLALERQFEEAVVRGDVAFVDRVTPPDFRFVHGDGWTRGGQPFANDDKAAFLKRVADKEYLVHDLDNVKVEMHGDVAITYGRYVSLFAPRNRDSIRACALELDLVRARVRAAQRTMAVSVPSHGARAERGAGGHRPHRRGA